MEKLKSLLDNEGMVDLYWEVAEPPRKIVHAYSDEAMEILDRYFGPFPAVLSKDNIRELRIMSDCCSGRPIEELLELVEKHGAIRVWPERWNARAK